MSNQAILDQLKNTHKVIQWATDIRGNWNGDDAGRQEDQAHQAGDIIEKALELQQLIKEMSVL